MHRPPDDSGLTAIGFIVLVVGLAALGLLAMRMM